MVKTNTGRLLGKDILDDIRETVTRAKEEYQKKLEQNSHEKVYKRILDEAVILIHKMWLCDAQDENNLIGITDSIEVSANGAFFITDDLRIYSEYGYKASNPDTQYCCFYDVFTFESEEEKEEYLRAVIERLPEGTVCEGADYFHGLEHCHRYTFKLKVDIK